VINYGVCKPICTRLRGGEKMRIRDLDIRLLEKHLRKTKKDLNNGNVVSNSTWWVFILDMERTLKFLKEELDPYGELDNRI
jgi:hypothetical protein